MKDKYLLYRITRPIIKALFYIIFLPTIKGKENINDERCVLAGNHTSNLDPLLLMSSTKRSIHFLAKKELFKFPYGIIFKHMGLIPVDRSRKSHESLEIAYNYLRNDNLCLVFPEGTTEKGRGLMDFKIGAVKMAHETHSPIVPFVITGKYIPLFGRIKIEFLSPIYVGDNLDEYNNKLRNIIKENLGD